MQVLFDLLLKHQLTLSCCESFTGGLFAGQLTQIPGISAVFKGGIVAYANDVKVNLVGVPPDLLTQEGAVSAACAREMALKTRLRLQSDLCVAFTGNAGPSASEAKPVGLWYLGIADAMRCEVFEFHSGLSRHELRQDAIRIAVEQLTKWIKDSHSQSTT